MEAKTPSRDAGSACYVYGIVRDDWRPSIEHLRGVDDAPIAFVRDGGLAAVVADVSSDAFSGISTDAGDTGSLEAAVRAHERVLDRCLSSGPVLPMRFATTFRGEDDLRGVLRERRAHFVAELDRFEGRSEWGVKAFVDPPVLATWVRGMRADLPEKERDLQASPPGSAYFARKQLERELTSEAESAVTASLGAAHERLASFADDSRLMAPAAKVRELRLNAAYLLARARQDDFQAALAMLGHEHASLGIRYQVSGPWPPYNFLSEEEAE